MDPAVTVTETFYKNGGGMPTDRRFAVNFYLVNL